MPDDVFFQLCSSGVCTLPLLSGAGMPWSSDDAPNILPALPGLCSSRCIFEVVDTGDVTALEFDALFVPEVVAVCELVALESESWEFDGQAVGAIAVAVAGA